MTELPSGLKYADVSGSPEGGQSQSLIGSGRLVMQKNSFPMFSCRYYRYFGGSQVGFPSFDTRPLWAIVSPSQGEASRP